MAANIHAEVVVSGGEIEDIVRDYLDDNRVIEGHLEQAEVLTESSDIWALVEDGVNQVIDERVPEQVHDHFTYGDGERDITRVIEDFTSEWLKDQLIDFERLSPESRCAFGQAFAAAVNEAVTTSAPSGDDVVEELARSKARVKFLEERVAAIEGGLTTVKAAFNHMVLKNVPPVNPIVTGFTPTGQRIVDAAEGR